MKRILIACLLAFAACSNSPAEQDNLDSDGGAAGGEAPRTCNPSNIKWVTVSDGYQNVPCQVRVLVETRSSALTPQQLIESLRSGAVDKGAIDLKVTPLVGVTMITLLEPGEQLSDVLLVQTDLESGYLIVVGEWPHSNLDQQIADDVLRLYQVLAPSANAKR